jgi:hypothetical protein
MWPPVPPSLAPDIPDGVAIPLAARPTPSFRYTWELRGEGVRPSEDPRGRAEIGQGRG